MKVVFECSEWLIFLWKGFGIKNAKVIGEYFPFFPKADANNLLSSCLSENLVIITIIFNAM